MTKEGARLAGASGSRGGVAVGRRAAVLVVELVMLALVVGALAGWLLASARQAVELGAPALSTECKLDWNCLECHMVTQE